MHCKLCHEYENEICRLPQFNYTGSNNGCVHLQLSVTVEHETGGPHKAAYNKFLTKRDWDLENELQKYADGKKLDECFLQNHLILHNLLILKKKLNSKPIIL